MTFVTYFQTRYEEVAAMFDRSPEHELTKEHRRLYAAEQLLNFRWIFKLLAKRSKHILTEADLVSNAVSVELDELGQFAEAAYSGRVITIDSLLNNIEVLLKPDFPLQGYTALRGAVVISHFKGRVAELPGYVVYRPSTKQLIVGISGTSSIKLAFHDLRTLKDRHPSGRGEVHSGFWSLYEGIKSTVLDAIAKGLKEHDVEEIALTGHSMGGSVSYLLAMDLLAAGSVNDAPLPRILKIAVFGAPRTGSPALVKYWWELVDKFQNVHGQGALAEYSVKAYNDGVPTLPPYGFGYWHFARDAMYLDKGSLYHIPREASEDALFTVSPPMQSTKHPPDYPLGGHNYYNDRDHERFIHRTDWLLQAKYGEDGWEDRYLQLFAMNQR